MDTSVLIIGGTGAIGRSLAPFLRENNYSVTTTTRGTPSSEQERSLDLTHLPIDLSYLGTHAVVIFLASLSRIQECERSPELSKLVNVTAVTTLASYFLSRGSFCIFGSTSAVFNDSCIRPDEYSPICPETVYGMHKAEAEKIFLDAGKQGSVLRMTKVITDLFPLFERWKQELQETQSISAFEDVSIAPISSLFLNEIILRVIQKKISGIIHLSANETISYVEIASRIAQKINKNAFVKGESAPHRPSICPILNSTRLPELGLQGLPSPFECL